MIRLPIAERPSWQHLAKEFGFHFHTMYGEPYWDETAYYQFTLQQIEQDIETPTEELHQMCMHVVNFVIGNEEYLTKFAIPEQFWDAIQDSWQSQDPTLYSRLDLAYSGKGPAKLYENNADTPTSLYETGFWQWLWLEQQVDAGKLSRGSDQFNSVQEKLVNRLTAIARHYDLREWHFACCQGNEEDRGTVQYLQDCAKEAGITAPFVFIEDIGLSESGFFTDTQDSVIQGMFKLYPWEFMLREEFGEHLEDAQVRWLEPMWKSILSNKALLPTLWQLFPNHPNLLPAWFEEDLDKANDLTLVKKPLYSREGANIEVMRNSQISQSTPGPYGDEGYIYQSWYPLPKFGGNHTLVGSWLIGDQAAGISIREDSQAITQDMSRYLPHIIL